jgi:hypothetical protein
MGKIFGCLGILIVFPLLFFALLFFNAWYFECIYNVGLTPLFTLFDIALPAIEYKYFVFITLIIGSIGLYFKDANKKESENKVTYSINDPDEFIEGLGKVFTPIINNILTRLLQLLILTIVCGICF